MRTYAKEMLFAVRERLRCLSRTTARLVAKSSAALRERQHETIGRNKENEGSGYEKGIWVRGEWRTLRYMDYCTQCPPLLYYHSMP